jgi:hypothetical protein
MGPRRRIALVAVAVTVAVGAAAPAGHAFPENGGTETAQLNMPADGIGISHTDELPAKATQADVNVTPLTDEQFFGQLTVVLTNSFFFDFSDRVGACVSVTETLVKDPDFFPAYTLPKDKTLQVLFLAACLQTALEISLKEQSKARPASAGCSQTRLFMSIKYKRTGSGYSAQVAPTSKRPKQPRSAVRVTCRRAPTGLRLQIRPRKRGQTLRRTVGRTLGLGVANPSKSPIRLKIAFTVK